MVATVPRGGRGWLEGPLASAAHVAVARVGRRRTRQLSATAEAYQVGSASHRPRTGGPRHVERTGRSTVHRALVRNGRYHATTPRPCWSAPRFPDFCRACSPGPVFDRAVPLAEVPEVVGRWTTGGGWRRAAHTGRRAGGAGVVRPAAKRCPR